MAAGNGELDGSRLFGRGRDLETIGVLARSRAGGGLDWRDGYELVSICRW
jgi:hypothetical protein